MYPVGGVTAAWSNTRRLENFYRELFERQTGEPSPHGKVQHNNQFFAELLHCTVYICPGTTIGVDDVLRMMHYQNAYRKPIVVWAPDGLDEQSQIRLDTQVKFSVGPDIEKLHEKVLQYGPPSSGQKWFDLWEKLNDLSSRTYIFRRLVLAGALVDITSRYVLENNLQELGKGFAIAMIAMGASWASSKIHKRIMRARAVTMYREDHARGYVVSEQNRSRHGVPQQFTRGGRLLSPESVDGVVRDVALGRSGGVTHLQIQVSSVGDSYVVVPVSEIGKGRDQLSQGELIGRMIRVSEEVNGKRAIELGEAPGRSRRNPAVPDPAFAFPTNQGPQRGARRRWIDPPNGSVPYAPNMAGRRNTVNGNGSNGHGPAVLMRNIVSEVGKVAAVYRMQRGNPVKDVSAGVVRLERPDVTISVLEKGQSFNVDKAFAYWKLKQQAGRAAVLYAPHGLGEDVTEEQLRLGDIKVAYEPTALDTLVRASWRPHPWTTQVSLLTQRLNRYSMRQPYFLIRCFWTGYIMTLTGVGDNVHSMLLGAALFIGLGGLSWAASAFLSRHERRKDVQQRYERADSGVYLPESQRFRTDVPHDLRGGLRLHREVVQGVCREIRDGFIRIQADSPDDCHILVPTKDVSSSRLPTRGNLVRIDHKGRLRILTMASLKFPPQPVPGDRRPAPHRVAVTPNATQRPAAVASQPRPAYASASGRQVLSSRR